MSVEVIGGLHWSLPGSRIFGLIEETGLSIYSAEYETAIEQSQLISGIAVKDSLGSALEADHSHFGIIGWANKVEVAFSALNEIQFRNLSAETLFLEFKVAGESLSPNTFKPIAALEQTLRIFGDLEIKDSGKNLYSVLLGAGEDLRVALAEDSSVLPTEVDGSEFSRLIWLEWMDRRPIVSDWIQRAVDSSWYCLGVNSLHLRWEPVKEKLAIVPSVLGYVGVWQWDSYFIALGLKYGDYELAKSQLELVLGFPQASGQLQDVIYDSGTLASFADLPLSELNSYAAGKGIPAAQLSGIPITKPPLATWAIHKLATSTKDQEINARFFEILFKQHQWWWSTAENSANGLPCYQHPYSSGLDDSPSFDDFQPATPPDLIAYLIMEGGLLGEMAATLGLEFDSALEKSRREILERALEEAWDSEKGFFRTFIESGFNASKTILTLIPLMNQLPEGYLEPLLAMIMDEKQFGGELSLPTVSRDDAKYLPARMWRGPVWANTNLLVIEGLETQGKSEQAQELALKTLRLIDAGQGSFEYYDSVTGKPAESAVGCFSWTAAVCIDLAVRYATNQDSISGALN